MIKPPMPQPALPSLIKNVFDTYYYMEPRSAVLALAHLTRGRFITHKPTGAQKDRLMLYLSLQLKYCQCLNFKEQRGLLDLFFDLSGQQQSGLFILESISLVIPRVNF